MPSSTSVLVDTSTRFSGLGWSGPPSRVLIAIATGEFQLVLTDYILDELFENPVIFRRTERSRLSVPSGTSSRPSSSMRGSG